MIWKASFISRTERQCSCKISKHFRVTSTVISLSLPWRVSHSLWFISGFAWAPLVLTSKILTLRTASHCHVSHTSHFLMPTAKEVLHHPLISWKIPWILPLPSRIFWTHHSALPFLWYSWYKFCFVNRESFFTCKNYAAFCSDRTHWWMNLS